MKELFRRGLLLFLSLALLIWCTGCAPESAEGTGSLSSSPEEGKVLFQLDPEAVKYIWLQRNVMGCWQLMRRLDIREDIEKIVEIFNHYRYYSSETVFAPHSNTTYYCVDFVTSPSDSNDSLGSCSFWASGKVSVKNSPAMGVCTIYTNDQPGYFDEVIPYFLKPRTALSSESGE